MHDTSITVPSFGLKLKASRVSIAVKRYQVHGNSYKAKHLINIVSCNSKVQFIFIMSESIVACRPPGLYSGLKACVSIRDFACYVIILKLGAVLMSMVCVNTMNMRMPMACAASGSHIDVHGPSCRYPDFVFKKSDACPLRGQRPSSGTPEKSPCPHPYESPLESCPSYTLGPRSTRTPSYHKHFGYYYLHECAYECEWTIQYMWKSEDSQLSPYIMTRTAALRTERWMCWLSWFLDPGGWSKAAVVGLYFIFPGICTLSL
ncbi:hypothetical protein STEG23_012564, partial [Scotinomys teguina]